jgi:prepilin-type N-terminal cleavage/methylation domain-containing protein
MNKNQKGFSLVELLVVVIIIGIIAAIAIPSLLASRKAANEASAISSLRTIHSAQSAYFGTTGNNTNYAANLAGLSGLIDASLITGSKSGYTFTVSGGAGDYCANGTPTGSNGSNSYGVGTDGVIYKKVGTTALGCSSNVLTISAASPIQ